MIKVKNQVATREPIPAFLIGLMPESLANLSWTDPQLGVQDCAWWPEQDQSPDLGQFEVYGDETLTLGAGVVIVTRAVMPMTQEQINASNSEQAAQINALQEKLAALG